MALEWDERKRLSNLRKHGIDFVDLEPLFEGPTSDKPDGRRDYGEARRIAVGRVGGMILSVVYTWRAEARRIISARKANRHEREDFYRYTVEESSQGQDRLEAAARHDRGGDRGGGHERS
jgi:uncharacterized DUF497 family protein